jgi:hypothetical protein
MGFGAKRTLCIGGVNRRGGETERITACYLYIWRQHKETHHIFLFKGKEE